MQFITEQDYQTQEVQKKSLKDKLIIFAKVTPAKRYMKVPLDAEELMIKIGDSWTIYYYMSCWITRGRSRWNWWNEKILPYYTEKGDLPFAKFQLDIAKTLGIHQSTVSRRIKNLLELELIEEVGTELYYDKAEMKVYSLGINYRDERGNPTERTFFEMKI